MEANNNNSVTLTLKSFSKKLTRVSHPIALSIEPFSAKLSRQTSAVTITVTVRRLGLVQVNKSKFVPPKQPHHQQTATVSAVAETINSAGSSPYQFPDLPIISTPQLESLELF